MIHRATVSLCAVIGLLAAGFVACCVGFVRTLAGQPVALSDVALFGVLFCGVTGAGLWSLFRAEFAGQMARDAMALEERRAKLPAASVAQTEPAEVTPGPDAEPARLHGWRVAMLRAVMYAEIYDWTFGTLGPQGVSVMDRADWDAVTDHLRDCAILHKREKSRTRYQDGWHPERARAVIRQGLPLPYPETTAPQVHSPRCTEAQLALHTQTAQAGPA